MALHPTIDAVTRRITERSRETRSDYLRRMDAARDSGAGRNLLAHRVNGQPPCIPARMR